MESGHEYDGEEEGSFTRLTGTLPLVVPSLPNLHLQVHLFLASLYLYLYDFSNSARIFSPLARAESKSPTM